MTQQAPAFFRRLGRLNQYLSHDFLGGPRITTQAWVWGVVFLTNIMLKEASMSRYPEWQAYRARTGMLLPRLRRPRQ